MGYSTLGGTGPLEARVLASLGGAAHRQEARGDTVHTLLQRGETEAAYWVVSLVRAGMVKHMDETSGPYCEPCSAAFYADATKRCGDPSGYADAFRQRMAAAIFAKAGA